LVLGSLLASQKESVLACTCSQKAMSFQGEKASMSQSGPRKRGSRGGTSSQVRLQKSDGRSEDIFFKTKLCAFWQEGRCLRGRECKYAHGSGDLNEEPDLAKTALCKTMLSGGQCANPSCTFAHSKEELRNTAHLQKNQMCAFFRFGRCQQGANCRNAHFDGELRSGRNDKSAQQDFLSDDELDELDHVPDLRWERSITMPPSIEAHADQPAASGALWADMKDDEQTLDDELDDVPDMWARMQTTPALGSSDPRPPSRSSSSRAGDAPGELSYQTWIRQCSTDDTLPEYYEGHFFCKQAPAPLQSPVTSGVQDSRGGYSPTLVMPCVANTNLGPVLMIPCSNIQGVPTVDGVQVQVAPAVPSPVEGVQLQGGTNAVQLQGGPQNIQNPLACQMSMMQQGTTHDPQLAKSRREKMTRW